MFETVPFTLEHNDTVHALHEDFEIDKYHLLMCQNCPVWQEPSCPYNFLDNW